MVVISSLRPIGFDTRSCYAGGLLSPTRSGATSTMERMMFRALLGSLSLIVLCRHGAGSGHAVDLRE